MFLAEDPFAFAKRVATAFKSRESTYEFLRYHLFVDSMPVDGMPLVSPEQLNRIMTLALNTKKMREKSIDTTAIVDELNFEYSRTMNRIIFDKEHSVAPANHIIKSVQLPPPAEVAGSRLLAIDMPAHDWAQQYCLFNFNSFLTKAELIAVTVKVKAECQKILKQRVFSPNPSKTLKPDEFEHSQLQTIGACAQSLKDGWLTALKNGIRNGLKDVGKGWFNLSETKREVYDISKLRKFLTMINFMMEDTLRFLVDDALHKYTHFIEGAMAYDVEVISISQVTSKQVVTAQQPPSKWPLFALELVARDGFITVNHSIERLTEMPLAIFDKGISSMADIPQLEPTIMDKLFWSHKPVLAAVHPTEDGVTAMRERIRKALTVALGHVQSYCALYHDYEAELQLDPADYLSRLGAAPKDEAGGDDHSSHAQQLDRLRVDLSKLVKLRKEAETKIPLHIQIGAFAINCEGVRKLVAERYQSFANLILDKLAQGSKMIADDLLSKYNETTKRLKKSMTNIEDVAELKEYSDGLPAMVETMMDQISIMLRNNDLLEDYRYECTKDDATRRWLCYSLPKKIYSQMEIAVKLANEDAERFHDTMVGDQDEFSMEIDGISNVVSTFYQHTDMARVDEVAAEVKKIQRRLQDAESKARQFNSRETLFEKDVTDYTYLQKIIKTFEPFQVFWLTAQDWQKEYAVWMDGPFIQLEPEEVDKTLQTQWRNMFKCTKTFADKVPDVHKLSVELKSQMDAFKEYIPLIQALRQPGMRERHWADLSKELGFPFHPDQHFTLKKAIFDLRLQDKLTDITKICDVAGKEFAIETALDKMEKEWEPVHVEVHDYRDTGTFILKGLDEIFQTLDDHITMTQSMTFSPFKKPFEERINKWERRLTLTSEILEEWLTCQRSWLYLEPIFSSEDIQKQLPTETKRFQHVDRNWRKYMADANKNSHVLSLCSSERMLTVFQESNKLLEMVSKGLTDYLETKRAAFARFYFLSNDELLEILSQTKDPQAVQPHLRKCFENVTFLEFDTSGSPMRIMSMKSGEGEIVPLTDPLAVKGNVENWLSDFENLMKKTIKDQIRTGTGTYLEQKRTDWVREWPAQIVLAVTQHYWSIEVEQALADAGLEGLTAYFQKMLDQLNDLVEMVRGSMPRLLSLTLGALIVIEVHARDVVQKMVDTEVSNPNDFQWISQLRYYWEHEDEFNVKQIQATFKYGCEYLGNTTRLVITPLTDRCYITLTGAMHLRLGGAPQGPAGTGKTESVKDLGKAIAKQTVVFNCQDGLDYIAMGKFFKGLASCGAWSCFDEFNRIDIEVLSVIAQQITTIQKAAKQGLTRFIFEGSEISLDATNAVFITMNPGYAGRTELPDNLKALFRPMAMMVPDYALIAEISLFSFGFITAKALSNKIVSTFKLSSEQLSSQDHYDFGMRAVKTVINAAGLLKRAEPQANEYTLLLRALQDVNRPKFLVEDLTLFEGIISDLFPGVPAPVREYGTLVESINQSCRDQRLQPVDSFTAKCIQLYETSVVRHGLMLVGPTGGGKTCCLRVLQQAMTDIAKSDTPGTFEKVKVSTLNPKSVTMGQLYGNFDENTHEWTDGVLANMIRQNVQEDTPDKKWIVCDGPVDALWIESMNTVLDDNKKLCLVSGEIISLDNSITMMFEVEDLAVASPATVSRCGMVYLEPGALGTQVLCDSWLPTLHPKFAQFSKRFGDLFESLTLPALTFVRRNCAEPVPTVDGNLVLSQFRILDCLQPKPDECIDADDPEAQTPDYASFVGPFFLFSLIWSVGASTDKTGRKKFDKWLREKAVEVSLDAKFLPPEDLSVYEFAFDVPKKQWVNWLATAPDYELDSATPFAEIVVPTVDTIRYTYLLDILLKKSIHVLCVGPTGTGKSVVVNEKLQNGMDDSFESNCLSFSASTSANQTQDIIDAKLDKRRKGIFGPPLGKKMIIFVDDLNMPAQERYFAQPPIELLRQWFDHKGWYDRKALQFFEIVDIMFAAAMGPPGGGRNPVTPRFLRHFNIVSFTDMEDTTLIRIFNTILGAWITSNFTEEFQVVAEQLVQCTINMYNTISSELLPTPAKSHYTFNLRDLSKVIQGVLGGEPKKIPDVAALVRLWCHENQRVFQDRLVSDEDREWFVNLMQGQVKDTFELDWVEIVGTSGRLLYGDYGVPNADPRLYDQITDFDKIVKTFEEYLEDYNAQHTKQMKLVMFLDAVEHVSRISRILRTPLANALLLGVGGSGRQSLTRLAAFAADFKVYSVEIVKGYGRNEWREDLKKTLLGAGLEGEPVVFLFSDTQIVSESFMEDINGVLSSGDVPNLFAAEDYETISHAMRPLCQSAGLPTTKNALFSYFTKRVRANLHVVLAMSPMGSAFRRRLRMYPSLVNCCTIDWFAEWPEEALQSVARDQFQDIEFPDPSVQASVCDVCCYIHQSVATASKKYLAELRRTNHVTPTSYLELLGTYRRLLGEKKLEVGRLKERLSIGLDKLLDTAEKVAVLEVELKEAQPVLLAKGKQVEELMVKIAADTEQAEETRSYCEKEEAEANAKAKATQAIKDDAEKDLAQALPALDAATASLKSLNRNDIVEIKAMGNPPAGVKMVMEAVCIMQGVKPIRKDDPAQLGKKIDDYWDNAKKELLVDPTKFLNGLFSYDKDNIPEAYITKVQPYVENDTFTPEAISKVSKACTSICLWVRAMYKYYHINRMVEPKRAQLAQSQIQLKETMEQLDVARRKLADVEQRLAQLEVTYKTTVAEKEHLANKVEETSTKIDRAQKLIGGLGGERARWEESVESLTVKYDHLVGDALQAAGAIGYMGAFTGQYRAALYKEWEEKLAWHSIPHTPNTTIGSVLADPVQIRAWGIAGLPSDTLSVENGIIISKSRRWPLMIDPESQANKWVKNMERQQGLDVMKLSDKEYLRALENAVRFGKPVLLENIGEELDPALEPLLLKQTFKQGGQELIQLGENAVPYHADFRFYMTTKLRNPAYAPETAVKVTLLNFAITSDGLVEQLLGIVVAEERPDLAELKSKLVVQNAAMKKEMEEIENKILRLLSESEGDILEDETLIDTLSDSKHTANQISTKVAEAEVTEREIDATSLEYKVVAERACILYFCIADLSNVDPMYQYSLAWFINLYRSGIQQTPPSSTLEGRLTNLNEFFTYSLYTNVTRSLFEQHKLLLSFLMTQRIMSHEGRSDSAEFKFLLAGATSAELSHANPATWMPTNSWLEICNLARLPAFEGLDNDVIEQLPLFQAVYDSSAPHTEPLPGKWNDLTTLQKLLFLRALRPDKVVEAVQNLVTEELGHKFIEAPPFDLGSVFSSSTPLTCIIFVLSTGADPAADFYKFADEQGFGKKNDGISLGQGQGPIAEKLIAAATERGSWVLLQNCHLAASWMSSLEKIVEHLDPERVHRDFRLWLTAMPTPHFPVTILQDGVKMTNEPPKGLKSNLMRSFLKFDDVMLQQSTKPRAWRKLLFGLCFLHAIVQDRRRFGPLGWNILYEFAQGDLQICIDQLQLFIDEYEEVPFVVLQFLTGEVNYGGRVTDDKDRRALGVIVKTYVSLDVLSKDYKFSESGTYYAPEVETVEGFNEYIRSLPINPAPEVFGLHENADITSAQNETFAMLGVLVELQPRSAAGAGGASRDDVIKTLADDFLSRLPTSLDILRAQQKYPTDYNESMNTVVTQEIIRYNKLLAVICKTLKDLLKALKGEVVMSEVLEAVGNSLYNNQVPETWANQAYPSLMPLASWVVDLEKRIVFVNNWLEGGHPNVYWVSGFFFPQAFLTGALQNFARALGVAIDTVSFSHIIRDDVDPMEAPKPEAGVLIYGLFLEGARWDLEWHRLADPRPKELFSEMPAIWLKPVTNKVKEDSGIYECPVYKTLSRAGTLSTTGHSTNFVLNLELPTFEPQQFWVKRGAGLFCALKY